MGVPIDGGSRGAPGDMFLLVKGAKCGLIKGEAQDEDHKGEIEVVSWSWGMEAVAGLGGESIKKATIRELKIGKRIDSASTALMGALRSNEPITKAVLTLRKAGKTRLEYFKLTIENGRVTEVAVEVDGDDPQPTENVRFAFNKITVEYVPQGKDGQPQGGTTFNDQFG